MALLTSKLTGLEIRIIGFFIANIMEQFAIREVSRHAKIDYKRTHATIQKLAQEDIIIKKRHANMDLCSLNLKGDLTSVHYVEMLRTKEFLDKHPELRTYIPTVKEKVKNAYYSLIIFGSFAKGKETKASDVDMLIIAPTRATAEEIERIVNGEALLLKQKVQPIVLDEKEFVENLSSKKLNVVVEAFKKHLILAGVEGFYNGVKQVI